jgi:asparagine synthase (glutamine-hydrolysing)
MLKTDLKNAIFSTVEETVKSSNSLGIAFSGGIDSTLLAGVCNNLTLNPKLLTVGFSNSHDLFYSKQISSRIKMTHLILEITSDDFTTACHKIQQKIQCKNTSHIENCIAFYFVGKLASSYGIKTILTANGFDELFCGYDSFRSIYHQGDLSINNAITDRLVNERELVEEINQVTADLGVLIRQPFLSKKFISMAMGIPVTYKIVGPNDLLRKHILRKLALSMCLPEESIIARKKAIQYGSLIHKNYKQLN